MLRPVIEGQKNSAGGSMLTVQIDRSLPTWRSRSQQARIAPIAAGQVVPMKAVAFDSFFVDEPRHQSIGDDRRVGEHRRRIVRKSPCNSAAAAPTFPDVDAAVDFRVAILRVDAVDVAMAELVQMVQHALDAAIGKQSNRRQAVAGEIAVENHDLVRLKRLDQPGGNLRSIGNDERALRLLDRFDHRLLVPMDELRRTQPDAALAWRNRRPRCAAA